MKHLALVLFVAMSITWSDESVAFTITGGQSGAWYDPAHDGEGYVLQVIDDRAVVYWFTYDRIGKQRWMIGIGAVQGSKIIFDELTTTHGGKFGPDFDPEEVEFTKWGSLELNFQDCHTGVASYKGPSDFGSGTLNLIRLTSIWGQSCDGSNSVSSGTGAGFLNPGFTGSWYDLSHNGEGFTVDILSETSALVFWFTYDTNGNQAWMFAVADIEGATIIATDILITSGGKFGPQFNPEDVVMKHWGKAVFTFSSCGSSIHAGSMRYLPPADFAPESTQFLYRLTAIDGLECDLLTKLYNISAKAKAAENIVIDGDVNNPLVRVLPNDLEGSRQGHQQLYPPARVVGYSTAVATGVKGDRFESEIDEWDIYLLALRAGESVSLTVSDWDESDPDKTDLDLYLVDVNSTDEPADSSLNLAKQELVTAPKDGNYFVLVHAYAGGSNYVLESGIVGAQQTSKLTLSADFVLDNLVAAPVELSGFPAASVNVAMKEQVSRIEKAFGLNRIQTSPSGSVLYQTGNVQFPTLAQHPLTKAGFATISPEKWHIIKLAKALSTNPAYRWAGPNYTMNAMTTPNDPFYGLQWHYPLIRLPEAWNLTKGSANVVVAVIDSGVYEHPDLAGRVQYSLGYDFVSSTFNSGDGDGLDSDARDPGKSYPIRGDYRSHGTHVAGTIGASTNNGVGVSGVDWNAVIMPVRALGLNGAGTCYDINESLLWAGRLPNASGGLPAKRADVINLSLAGYGGCIGMQETINRLVSSGVIVVAAAGNDTLPIPMYPASFDNVISVSATTMTDELAPYSNYGNTIDIAAPGGDTNRDLNDDSYVDGVLSTSMIVQQGSAQRQAYYLFMEGTSMASPHVAGVITLMKSVYPSLGPAQFQAGLATGALTVDLAKNGPSNKDQEFGYGRIDAFKAVQWAKQQVSQPSAAFITADTSAIDFSSNLNSAEMVIAKAGTGALKISSYGVTEPWISVSKVSTDANGFGRYRVNISRDGLTDSRYAGWIAFDATDGSRFWVSVLMRVGQVSVGEVGWAAALVLDQWTFSNVKQWVGTDSSGAMDVQFDDMPPGIYYLLIGTDNDNDLEICDEGELCQIYPINGNPSPLEIIDRNITLGSFIVGFRGQGGVGGASTATGDEGARLLNSGFSGRYEKH